MFIKPILLTAFLFPTLTCAANNTQPSSAFLVPVSKDDHSVDSLDKNPLASAFLKPNQLAPAFFSFREGEREQHAEWISNGPLNEATCHNAAFKIVFGDDYKENCVLPLASWQGLNLFEKNNSVLKLNRTKTYLGQATFAQLLLNPCTSAAEITKRQEAIRYFVENPNALREINDALKTIHAHEPKMFRWWYHTKQAIRKPGTSSSWINGITTRSLQALGLALPLISAYGFHYFDQQPYWNNGVHNNLKPWGALLSAEGCAVGWMFSILAGFHIHCLRTVQDLLISYARVVDAAQKIAPLISQTPALKNIPGSEDLLHYCATQSGDLHKLKQLFSTKTFASEASIFSSAGNIQSAHNLLYATTRDMYKLLQAIGTIDVFASMATLMRDHEIQQNKYCFVELDEEDQPTLEAVNMWSSACPLQTPLLQTVALTNSKHNLLFTGPFRSGKSSTIRTLCQAVLMAQAFGIAPAEKFRFQPFAFIHFVATDIKKNDPSAPNELATHHLLFEKLDALTSYQKALVVFDTTQDPWTDQAITQQTQLLKRYPNTLTIFSTGNEKFTLDNFTHYHMSPAQEQDRLPAWVFVVRPR